MAPSNKNLESQRNILITKLEMFKNFIDNIDLEENTALEELEVRLESIVETNKCFQDIQEKIEVSAVDPNVEQEHRIYFENSYFRYAAKAKKILKPIGNNQTPVRAISNHIRMPEIKLPIFSGKFNEWVNFYDSFQALIHNNQSIPSINKFQYLKSCLTGEAARVIQSIVISEENYSNAWNRLVERYEDREGITLKHIKSLFEIPTLAKESHGSIRQLADEVANHVQAIRTLDSPYPDNKLEDRLLIFLVVSKLDSNSRRDWENYLSRTQQKAPLLEFLLNFLIERSKLLQKLNVERPGDMNPQSFKNPRKPVNCYATQRLNCSYCKEAHQIYFCRKFLDLSIDNRIQEVKNRKLCVNCLKGNHFSQICQSTNSCKVCKQKHNSLLHKNSVDTADNSNPQPSTSHIVNNFAQSNRIQTILSTAIVKIVNQQGRSCEARVLLDSGSQSHFISRKLCDKLKLSQNSVSIPVSGIGGGSSNIKISCTTSVIIQSKTCNYQSEIQCLVLPNITGILPNEQIPTQFIKIPKNVRLADPKFDEPREIDLLIGASLFWDLLSVGHIKLPESNLNLNKTKLGWVISGTYYSTNQAITCNFSKQSNDLYNQISKFWEIEEINSNKKYLSKSEQFCENSFMQSTTRDDSGRFIVRIPFRDNVNNLGDSFSQALNRFFNLERKLQKNPEMQSEYIQFMNEYEQLGHMSEIKFDNHAKGFYLPHHGIIKNDSVTTKLRVVFDGSAKTSTGLSLNDVQYTGPSLQNDLFSVLLRFRKHKFVIKADITKMYRQILIEDKQREFQKIIWRSNPTDTIKIYKLHTVTYGTASAPYLAIRCLLQLASDYEDKFPLFSKIIREDFYVDDLLTGAESVENIVQIKSSLSSILQSSGFELRKWVSNVNPCGNEQLPNLLINNEPYEAKTLGIKWDHFKDELSYTVNTNTDRKVTKRKLLSTIAQIFDPIGLLGPCIITAKIILQKLWKLKVNWDESIPLELLEEWYEFRDNLITLNDIRIPRHVVIPNPKQIQLHGFCDASQSAYGACIYLKTIDYSNNICVKLLCAKSRVAPVKTLTIPRLELCGALLLCQLATTIKRALELKIDIEIYWCDSTIVLGWVSGSPDRWKSFVANRVSEIQSLSKDASWSHVSTHDNPADLLSRGINPKELKSKAIWWNGPSFLHNLENPQIVSKKYDQEIPEQKKSHQCSLNVVTSDFCEIFKKFSSFLKMRRVMAYVLRFINNSKSNKVKSLGAITVKEIEMSETLLVKLVQNSVFGKEFYDLTNKKSVSKNSPLLSLNPFIDSNGIIRVGGRLKHANLSFSQKYPIILPGSHPFTKLLIQSVHIQEMHSGIEGTLMALRLKYWPIAGKNHVKQVLRKCLPCFRTLTKPKYPPMGDLPLCRVNEFRPFIQCGVDYAGPFLIQEGSYTRKKLIKVYVAVFICMATKAVHIEVVNQLTTASFIAALKRFVARRGRITDLFSDNGKNFVGSNNELKRLQQLFEKELDGCEILKFCTEAQITWHFIPPRAPNFGGLWEAAIKSMKRHLKRVLGESHLNYESFITILTQIESIMNSRPLTPLSTDPSDLLPLTPGHFLIGESMNAIPEPSVDHLPINKLDRWQRIQRLKSHFWKRWHREYITGLQQRQKWSSKSVNCPSIGDLVIIKEENLPPLKWALGRIVELHPGSDSVIRVVSIKTQSGIIKRATSKVCVLPNEQ